MLPELVILQSFRFVIVIKFLLFPLSRLESNSELFKYELDNPISKTL